MRELLYHDFKIIDNQLPPLYRKRAQL